MAAHGKTVLLCPLHHLDGVLVKLHNQTAFRLTGSLIQNIIGLHGILHGDAVKLVKDQPAGVGIVDHLRRQTGAGLHAVLREEFL